MVRVATGWTPAYLKKGGSWNYRCICQSGCKDELQEKLMPSEGPGFICVKLNVADAIMMKLIEWFTISKTLLVTSTSAYPKRTIAR